MDRTEQSNEIIGSDEWYDEIKKMPTSLNQEHLFEQQYPIKGNCEEVMKLLYQAKEDDKLNREKVSNEQILPGYVLYKMFVGGFVLEDYTVETFIQRGYVTDKELATEIWEKFQPVVQYFAHKQFPYFIEYLRDTFKNFSNSHYYKALNSKVGVQSYTSFASYQRSVLIWNPLRYIE